MIKIFTDVPLDVDHGVNEPQYRPCQNCNAEPGILHIIFEKSIQNLEDKPRTIQTGELRLCPKCCKALSDSIEEKFNPHYPFDDKTIEHTKAKIIEKFDEAIEKQNRHIATHFDGGVLEGLSEGRKLVEETTEDILNG